MTLMVTVIAAITSTILWYFHPKRSELKIGALALMYWGASIMWLIDSIVEYAEEGMEIFYAGGADLLNDLMLGCSVTVLGLIVWIVMLMVNDPNRIIRRA